VNGLHSMFDNVGQWACLVSATVTHHFTELYRPLVLLCFSVSGTTVSDSQTAHVVSASTSRPRPTDPSVVRICPDGRCLFRCIAASGLRCLRIAERSELGTILDDGLRELERSFADDIRQEVVAFLCSHTEMLSSMSVSLPLLLDRNPGECFPSVENRLRSMTRSDEYGGYLEMVAIAYLIKRPIHVYHQGECLKLIAKIPTNHYCNESPVVVLHNYDVQHHSGHFNLLIQNDNNENLLTQEAFHSKVAVSRQRSSPSLEELLQFSDLNTVPTSSYVAQAEQ